MGLRPSSFPAPPPRKVGALVVDYQLAVLVEAFRVPSDDPKRPLRCRFARGDDLAAGSQRVAGGDGPVEGQLIDAEKRPARLAELFAAESNDCAEHEQRVDAGARMAVGAPLLGR